MTPVRFQECQRYDIQLDAEVLLLMAMTPAGTYSAEVKLGDAKKLRGYRAAFREKAIDLIVAGANPCKVELEGV